MNIQPNLTQQIPTRIFRVNHLGGFAILQNIEPMTWIIENTNIVTVAEVSSVGQAYVDACNQYSRDTWRKNPYTQPIVPKFDDICRTPYQTPGFIAQISTNRFFAIANRDYVGIYDEVKGAVEFMNYFRWCLLQEFSTVDAAKLWLNECFILPMLAMSAYVTEPIEYIKNLPLNTAVPVRYRQWWQNNLPAVNNMPFSQPQFLLSPKEE